MKRSRSRYAWIAAILVGFAITPLSVLADTDELAAWEAALQSGTSQDVFAFIEAYPNGQHAKEAKVLMIDLLWLELEDESQTPASQADDMTAAVEEEVPVGEEVVVGEEAAIETNVIELRSFDGFIALKGVIIDYDSKLITIQTSQGVLGIENLGITCIGAACPPELLAAR